MMKKINFVYPILAFVLLTISSCKKEDDGVVSFPLRDRAEEAQVANAEITTYLETHFYNYEEFANPDADFDYRIKFDTIAGDNASKAPLMDQVSSKIVTDREEENITYTLYYLSVIEGEGKQVNFPDIVTLSYEGRLLSNNSLFDSSVNPVRFDLTQVINGFQDGLKEFKTATNIIENEDGTVTYENYGVGAVFIPSGIGYFSNSPSFALPAYSQLIFTFQVYATQNGDQDDDGVPSIFEDLNNNDLEEDDDTDGDFVPNYADNDDDNDGRLTKNEIETNEYMLNEGDPEPTLAENEVEVDRVYDAENNTTVISTVVFTDVDNDGVPNYLDKDN